MGVVYKIKHQRMGKIAAMKVLHADLAQDPEVVGRFEREAEAVSRLAHPNTVQVFDFGTEGGALYLVMEFVRGQDLGALIDRVGRVVAVRRSRRPAVAGTLGSRSTATRALCAELMSADWII